VDELELREVSPADAVMLQLIGELRVRAWRSEAPVPAAQTTWLDKYDLYSRHWAVFNAGRLVASGRLSVHAAVGELPDAECYIGVFTKLLPAPIASLNRLVVDPSARGRGLSRRLDLARVEAAQEMGCRSVVGATQSGSRRVQQLLEIGFVVIGSGGHFVEMGIPGALPPTVMLCSLPRGGGRPEEEPPIPVAARSRDGQDPLADN
jgi:GNAT superfamily N-acetyltransferase